MPKYHYDFQQNRWELASWNTSRVGGRLNGNSGLAQQVGTQSAEGKSSEYVYDTSHHHPRNVVDTTSTSCCSSQYFKEGRISDATSDSEVIQYLLCILTAPLPLFQLFSISNWLYHAGATDSDTKTNASQRHCICTFSIEGCRQWRVRN